jgi:AcrR family transcriptional regulator
MSAGRKRAFDKAEALDKAMRVFWDNGYSGTSVNDLAEALGINKPSLYAAFGNKERLFAAAVEHYMSRYGAPLMERLARPAEAPLAERMRSYLLGIVNLVSDTESPKGCLFVKSNCESGSAAMPENVSAALQDMGSAVERALTERLQADRKRGQLLPSTDPRDFAGYLLSVMYGLSVLARQGKSREELEAIVEVTINALPVPRG